VSADVDMAQVTTQEEKFDPDGQVIRSESTTDENSKERSATGSGQASVAANIPTGAADDGSDSTNSTGRQESTTNYEISKSVRTEVQQPGTIKRLSVAVAVDGLTVIGKDGKAGPYTPRSAQEMANIEQLVRAAVGFNQERGDDVKVVNVKFPTAEDPDGVSAANPLTGFDKNDIMRAAELGVLAVVGILMIFFVARPLVSGGGGSGGRGGKGAGGAPAVTRIMVTPDGQQMAIAADGTVNQLALPGPGGDDGAARIDMARVDGQVRVSTVKKVAEFVDNHPEESVAILRSWLHETT
jgi:flagellar M-ring protein FliF